ncbi:NUDIX domain-containing protein [Cognaticolwellia beringensis]|uniref:NUDIX domain-containing protein n=1 Tax=Cognaticolwellia beringensis TaxID=1967665 RepID=A0A222G6Z6_9GAMM|nr:NUDIX domain-containing protein [Cognaticolwellia beringensis]ASP47581.1 NUDIX domain-containing protein [Cognaticolwellia beringensis]
MKKYVTGFLFSQDASQVVLIEKINPQWQHGLFNGVGGKIEANERSVDAMVREFTEETGVITNTVDWTCYAKIHRPNFYDVDMYFAFSDLAFSARTIEQEQVHIIKLSELPANIIPNLHWLIPLALDKQANFTTPVLIKEIAEERIKA